MSIELGFLTFVPYPDDETAGAAGTAARSLRDGLELFERAEALGYDTGWVRVRHFEHFLASPLPFFAALSQRTSRIHFGTAVIPARYESPVRLAEDAATVDLLSGGRLELGVSGGFAHLAEVFDGVFGSSDLSFRDETDARLARLRAALAGEVVGVATAPLMSVPAGADLVVQPHAPGLVDRIWYGPGTAESAERAGRAGYNIQVSTLNTEETGLSFTEQQRVQIRGYREAFDAAHGGSGRRSRVAVGRIVVPILDDRDEAIHRPFIDGYDARMLPDGRPRTPDGSIVAKPMRFGPVLSGDPSRIVDDLLADVAVAEADSLTITLPAVGGTEAHARILEIIAERIAPALGWEPATD